MKNDTIKQTIKETRERHKNMRCRVIEVKCVKGKLSKTDKNALDTVFREGKWFRNDLLAKGDTSLFDDKVKFVNVKVGDIFEERHLTTLSSHMKQSIVDSVKSEIKGLSTKKSKGDKIGRLKFKSVCNSINLKQYGNT